MNNEVCKITFIFRTNEKPYVEFYEKYEDGTSLKGVGDDVLTLALDKIKTLVNEPLSDTSKLQKVKIIK